MTSRNKKPVLTQGFYGTKYLHNSSVTKSNYIIALTIYYKLKKLDPMSKYAQTYRNKDMMHLLKNNFRRRNHFDKQCNTKSHIIPNINECMKKNNTKNYKPNSKFNISN